MNVLSPPHPTLNTQPDVATPLETLARQVSECTQCDLSAGRTNTVFAEGNSTAPLMLIGEAPGQQEDETGVPFVGRSGQLLTQLLADANLHRPQDVYICNVVKCRPPENRPPKPDEVAACRGYLARQIALVRPKIILLVGATALRWVLNQTTPISKIRGQWLDLSEDAPFYGARAMAIFHPSYLLRYGSREAGSPRGLTAKDLQGVRDVLDQV